MLSVQEGLRNFWLKDLHGISENPSEGIATWLLKREFVFTSVASATDFTLRVLNTHGATKAFAYDASRMASAAFETFISINEPPRLPRSCGWILIRAYYGAFFAAHSLTRMFGVICFQIDALQKNALDRVATALGVLPPGGFEGGFYIGTFDGVSSEFRLVKSTASTTGSHGILWAQFAKMLRNQSNELLQKSSLYNDAAILLADICDLMCQSGQNGGTWLSHIRNSVNYRHELGVWFPYKASTVTARDVVKITAQWNKAPLKVMLKYPKKREVEQHAALCTAIASLCNVVVGDMSAASTRSRSFHQYGALALAKFAYGTP